ARMTCPDSARVAVGRLLGLIPWKAPATRLTLPDRLLLIRHPAENPAAGTVVVSTNTTTASRRRWWAKRRQPGGASACRGGPPLSRRSFMITSSDSLIAVPPPPLTRDVAGAGLRVVPDRLP